MMIEIIAKEQRNGNIGKCPRCGGVMEKELLHNALSRHEDVYICSDCGTDEAMRNMFGSPLPIENWHFRKV